MRKLKCILLVDDDEATNFLNQMILEDADCAETIKIAMDGAQALNYLKSKQDGKHPQPDLIFLDLNMPGMDGWEFLQHYNELSDDEKGGIVIVMLTTSINPDDEQKAKSTGVVRNFLNKPLTIESLGQIIHQYFGPDYQVIGYS